MIWTRIQAFLHSPTIKMLERQRDAMIEELREKAGAS